MRNFKHVAAGIISIALLSHCGAAMGQTAFAGTAVVEDLGEVKTQLKSPDANVRWRAVDTLEKASSPEAADLLIQELNDYGIANLHGVVVQEAIRVLGKRKETKAVDPLIKILLAGPRTVRIDGRRTTVDFSQMAAQALGEIGNDKATDPLITVLKSEYNEGIRAGFTNDWCCVQALGRIGNPKSVEIIMLAIRATSKTVTRYSNTPPLIATGFVFQERKYYYDALQNIHAPETTLALLGVIANPPRVTFSNGSNDLERTGFILKMQKDSTAIKQLIILLTKFESEPVPKDDGDALTLKQACAEALANITSQSTFDIDIIAWNRWYAANANTLPPQLSLESTPQKKVQASSAPSTLPSTRPTQTPAEIQAVANIQRQIEIVQRELDAADPGSPERAQLAEQLLELREKLNSIK